MGLAYRHRFNGASNPAWRGGKWGYKGINWAAISAIVVSSSPCVYCGGPAILAHHVVPQRFWRDLDASNVRANLVAACQPCHGTRPEHYWHRVPDDLFDPLAHTRTASRRVRADIRPYPPCEICGLPCRRHRSRFCSYSCSNRARWANGIYGPDLVRNITGTRRQAAEGVADVE